MENIKIIINEEHPLQTEQRLKYLLEEKSELDREVRAGEHAKMELKKVNKDLNDCYKTLIKNSPHK